MKLSTVLSTQSTDWILTILLAGLSFLITGWVATAVFQSYPFSMDEYSYLYQAKIFASGKLYEVVDRNYYLLSEIHMRSVDGRFFSKYPPLWAFLLSIGERIGSPQLVNPLLTGLTTAVIYRAMSRYFGLLAGALTALLFTTNPYVVGYGASMFSQPLALLISTIVIVLYWPYRERSSLRLVAAAGALAALLCLSRVADGFCLYVAFALGILSSALPARRKAIHVGVLSAVSLAGPLLLCIFNWWTVGEFSLALYRVHDGELRVLVPGETFVHSIWLSVWAYVQEFRTSAMENFTQNFLAVIGWGFWTLAAGGLSVERTRIRWMAGWFFLIVVAVYNLHPGLGWPQYGARYWYVAFGGLTLVAGGLLGIVANRVRPALAVILAVAVIALQADDCLDDLKVYARRFDVVNAVRADIPRHCPKPSIVVLQDPLNQPTWSEFRPDMVIWSDFKRQGFGRRSHHIILPKQALPDRLEKLLPGLPICVYEFDIFDHVPGMRVQGKS